MFFFFKKKKNIVEESLQGPVNRQGQGWGLLDTPESGMEAGWGWFLVAEMELINRLELDPLPSLFPIQSLILCGKNRNRHYKVTLYF